ncbi:MAG: hypothetical protein J4G04_03770 [Nitrosopumilaceae archaeon]|nr:hypothetical protein [Nitrosopumilaceae archaeon]
MDGCNDDGKCSAKIPESFFSLCGEEIRDALRASSSGKQKEMCDCIILDSIENRITLAELKSGKPKANMVKHAKNQLKEGMVVLAEMLSQAGKLEIDLQLVLFSKKFTNRSAVMELQKPIEYSGLKTRITRADCCAYLPDSYVRVRQSKLPSV